MQTSSGAENSHGVPSNHSKPGGRTTNTTRTNSLPPLSHLDTLRIKSPTCLSRPRMRASPDRSCVCSVATCEPTKEPPTPSQHKELNTARETSKAWQRRSHGTRQEDKSGGATTYGTTRSRPRRARRVRVRGRTGRGGRGWYHRMYIALPFPIFEARLPSHPWRQAGRSRPTQYTTNNSPKTRTTPLL